MLGFLWFSFSFSFFSLSRSYIQTAVQPHKPPVAMKEGVSGRQEWAAGGGERQELSLLPHQRKLLLALAGGGCPHPLLPGVEFNASISPRHTLLRGLWNDSLRHTSNVRYPLPVLLFLEVQGRHEATLGQVLTCSSHFPGRRHEVTRSQVLPAVKAGTYCSPASVQSSASRCYKVPNLLGKCFLYACNILQWGSGNLFVFVII